MVNLLAETVNQTSWFGLEHTLYFVISNILGISALVLCFIFCKTKKSRNIVLLTTAGLLLTAAVIHRIILAFHPASDPYGGWAYLIPSSFCSLTAFLFSIAVLTIKNKNHPIFHCLMYLAFLGPVIVKLYPDWLFRDGFAHPATLIALIHHTFSFYLCMMIIIFGMWRPSLKQWHAVYLGAALYMMLGYFLIEIMDITASMGVFYTITDYAYVYLGGGNFERQPVTFERGRHIVLDWHWSTSLMILAAYHFMVMFGYFGGMKLWQKYKSKPKESPEPVVVEDVKVENTSNKKMSPAKN